MAISSEYKLYKMDMKAELKSLMKEQGIVPLYYAADAGVSIELMRAMYQGGIRTTEYANRGEQAMKNFKEMRKACDQISIICSVFRAA